MRFSASRRREKDAADRLYAACVRAAREPALYLDYGVEDGLQGRFEMLALHLFPVLYRLMHQPGDDPDLAQHVAESFVTDMDAAFREMGVGDVVVPKRMTTLYRSFAGRITAYKESFEAGGDALAAAISRNVFPDAQPGDAQAARHAHALAAHAQTAVARMRSADLDALRRGQAPFPLPPPLNT